MVKYDGSMVEQTLSNLKTQGSTVGFQAVLILRVLPPSNWCIALDYTCFVGIAFAGQLKMKMIYNNAHP